MANSGANLAAEKWVIAEGLAAVAGGPFSSRKMKLTWGGEFAFDVVSANGGIVGNISTSRARTAGGLQATAQIQKIKCDTLYLLHAKGAKTRLLIFTEADMKAHFEKEARNGRFPRGVKLIHVALPEKIQQLVEASRKEASRETSPRRK